MGHPRGRIRAPGLRRAAIAFAIAILPTATVRAQQVSVGTPTGAAGGGSVVGQPLGAASFPDISMPSIAPFAAAGRRSSHVPASALSTPGAPVHTTLGAQLTIPAVQPAQAPVQYGELSVEAEVTNYGPPDGMSLDSAIEILVKQNLDLLAARMEIPMADADVLSANLRANPNVTIYIQRKPRPVKARIAGGEERAALWGKLISTVPTYADYQKLTTREIPLVVFE